MKWDLTTITDASSEGDLVTFVISSVQISDQGTKSEATVTRSHDDFAWLYSSIYDKKEYDGFLLPPCPPRPNFEGPRERFYRLNEEQSEMSVEEYNRLKAELDNEYLRLFKKTVAHHEVFLQRLVRHPVIKRDEELRVFLQYEHDLEVRTANAREKISYFMSRIQQKADSSLRLSHQEDGDDFFCKQRQFLQRHLQHNKDAAQYCSMQIQSHHAISQDCLILCASLYETTCSSASSSKVHDIWKRTLHLMTVFYDAYRNGIRKLATDRELKVLDLLKDGQELGSSASDMLYKRAVALNYYTQSSKKLDTLRKKPTHSDSDLKLAEATHSKAWEDFELISSRGKAELQLFHINRVRHVAEYISDYASLQITHHKEILTELRKSLSCLKVM